MGEDALKEHILDKYKQDILPNNKGSSIIHGYERIAIYNNNNRKLFYMDKNTFQPYRIRIGVHKVFLCFVRNGESYIRDYIIHPPSRKYSPKDLMNKIKSAL